jgi:hypothetical protein
MITQTVGTLLKEQVTLDLNCIDRLYLNACQPRLQTGAGVVYFFKQHRGAQVASTTLMAPMSRTFVSRIRQFARDEGVVMERFERGVRKDDVTQGCLSSFQGTEGALHIGVAQEQCASFRAEKKINPANGQPFPWLARTTVMCNQYCVCLVDEDFGPLFIRFSSCFPYTARVCLNGHEYLKRQLTRRGVSYEALDNGLLSCAQPDLARSSADGLDERRIDGVVRKWLARLPSPFTAQDAAAGFRYELSILQAEFARTRVFDRPLSGRYFFEEVIRENLDLGRPSRVSLIFNRRVTRRTPGTFRTRVVTTGVTPALHISCQDSKIKQYFKEDRARRTETTVNNTRNFGIGRKLANLPALRAVGFTANRRLLDVETLSQDCRIGTRVFDRVTGRRTVAGQTAAALKSGDPRVMALCQALVLFGLLPHGFRHAHVREHVVQLLGRTPEQYRSGQMTCDLRRLRLHGLIERVPSSQRYRVTTAGLRITLFFTRVHSRLLRGGLSQLFDPTEVGQSRPLVAAVNRVEKLIEGHIQCAKIAA